MHSMTGYGRGTAPFGRTAVTAEIRTVNGRFLEPKTRLPRLLAGREAEVERLLRTRLERGSATVNVTVEAAEAGADVPLRVNAEAARGYGRLLRELADAAGVAEPVTLDHVLRFTDVLTTDLDGDATSADDAEALWTSAAAALEGALDDLLAMRQQEGRALYDDLVARLADLDAATARVEARAPLRVAEARARLAERLDALVGEGRVQAERIEQEIALLADRLDVTEECVRLRAHLTFFREAMDGAEPAGRRLGFLVQEMGREVNTIGSKANDPLVQHEAVGMKETLEKIREQVANVE